MKKFLFMLAAVFCCTLMAVTLTSCGDDDDNTPSGPYTYTVSMSRASGSEALQIFAAYKTALKEAGLEVESTSDFKANSDAIVVAACKKAEENLNSMDIKGSYTVNTTNKTLDKVIHTWTKN